MGRLRGGPGWPCNLTAASLCWDPLDGSSIVDNNWAVGADYLVGVWFGEDGLLGATGRDQVTALIAIYGPRTTVLVGLDDGVYEFSYGCTPTAASSPAAPSSLDLLRKRIKISPDTRSSPGEHAG